MANVGSRIVADSNFDQDGGVFGAWDRDANGRVCFHYDPPPEKDAPHEDHWHLIGNDHMNVTCHNGGYVQIYDWTRGPKILNRWHPETGNYAGGFKLLCIDGITFPTLKAWLPEGATMERVFGQGYFKKTTRFRGVVVEEKIQVVIGGYGAHVHSNIHITNERAEPVEIRYADIWQLNQHQLVVAPVMTNGLDRPVEYLRSRLNRKLKYQIKPKCGWHVEAYGEYHRPGKYDPAAPSFADYGKSLSFFSEFKTFADGASEIIAGPIDINSFPIAAQEAYSQRAFPTGPALGVMHYFTIEGGSSKWFDSSFHHSHWDRTVDVPRSLPFQIEPGSDGFIDSYPTPTFTAPGHEALARELEWHAYYLQAGCLYSDYHDAHFVDQGSAYGYLQGGSGAPRDFALFILPLVYLRPALAKDMLRFLFRAQRHKDGGFPYAFFGYGKASGGGVHSLSSDLDLFVVLALAEYLNVTRDYAFLEEENLYSPKSDGVSATVLDHLRASWRHLREKIGTGPNGMIRAGTGDWNDVLLAYSRMPPVTIWRGESSLNAGLATLALPAIAEAIEHADADLARDMRTMAAEQGAALRNLWTGEWVARGYLGYFGKRLGEDRIFLDTQAWGVLGGVWDDAQRETLFANIQRICVDPQPAGALALYPPMKGPLLVPGSDTNGGTWAAVDAWTAWAWAEHDPESAWRFFLHTTMAARTAAYPDVWYSVWSGPDSYNAHYHKKPGETFNHNATPMALYPVMNMNRHAGPLLDILKFAGFGARGGRIVVAPRMPMVAFSLAFPLLGCTYAETSCSGYYLAPNDGVFPFTIRPPAGVEAGALRVTLNGDAVDVALEDGMVVFERRLKRGAKVTWEVGRGS
ncbi:MAG: hypothetical protein GC168_09875 [Candidatus Hydrogenedens sp.]|nr:hypothetical protein [Candidatus Hydrogenedens sp.]